jgi:hypothetical protein
MDPITLALSAALAAGAAGALKGTADVGERAIVDGYEGLKGLLRRKLGAGGDVVEAVEALEKKPDSEGRKATLQEEIEASKALDDAEILEAAKALLARIEAQPGGSQTVQQIAHGTGIARASHGGTASVTMGSGALPTKP